MSNYLTNNPRFKIEINDIRLKYFEKTNTIEH
jgi:hypothetical protein